MQKEKDNNFPHDIFRDMSERVKPEDHRHPRVVVVGDWDGMLSWGELSAAGNVLDTTLTGVVLDEIEQKIKAGSLAGTVVKDGITYAFVFGKYR